MKVVLGNVDYLQHTSSEGAELQNGLAEAGYKIVGPGYDNEEDAGAIIKRYRPLRVFVQDVRDWLPSSNISFRKDVGYTNLQAIGASGTPAFTVIKDAWGWQKEHSQLIRDIDARAVACYYRLDMVRKVAPWLQRPLRRIYHSVDREIIGRLLANQRPRKNALVSGMLQPCYPLRIWAFEHAAELGLDTRKHPGYGNAGTDTPRYLEALSGYKVHLATASQWGCAFRKIIESVCCGCTVITNLPESDRLPVIDDALVRISSAIDLPELRDVIADTVAKWKAKDRIELAVEALSFYDYRAAGRRLAADIERICDIPS